MRGLRLGADDWIGKPSHPEEVMARIEAVVRRRKRAAARDDVGPLVAGELEIRADQYQAFVSGQSIGLTRREFELLQLLAEAHGQVIEREEIYQKVWGYAMAHGDRSVDVFVRKLRQKLQRHSANWRYIHTHFGIGYRFDPEPVGAVGMRPSRSPPRPATPQAAAEDSAQERRPRLAPDGPVTSRSPEVHSNVTTLRRRERRSSRAMEGATAPAVADERAIAGRRGPRRPVYAGRLEIRPADHAALVDGRPLMLTVRELQLLTELAHNAERVMTREELYARVWGRDYQKSDRSVDVYVGRLRAKLGRALPGRRFIHTHTGIGYRFSPEA